MTVCGCLYWCEVNGNGILVCVCVCTSVNLSVCVCEGVQVLVTVCGCLYWCEVNGNNIVVSKKKSECVCVGHKCSTDEGTK